MSTTQVRIISDIHYGNRVSVVTDFAQLAPLLEDTKTLIFNGDTIDTRPGPDPEYARKLEEDRQKFDHRGATQLKYITGNHDPDISPHHFLELAKGSVLVTHGDVLFPNIVPWGRDAALARELVDRALGEPHQHDEELSRLLRAHRQASANIPQCHQAERNGWRFLTDTIWPPQRLFHILNSWRQFPGLGETLLHTQRPRARFLIAGHTHWPGIWRRADGRVVINTGSYCPPCGRLMVEITEDRLLVRRIRNRHGDFHPGRIIAQFTLTPPTTSSNHMT